jgi:hypothetical protein
LVQKRQQGIRRIEATNNHNDERFHDEPIRIRFGVPAGSLGRLRGPGDRSVSTTRLTRTLVCRSISVPPSC